MKIFGFEFGKQKLERIQDQIPEIQVVIPSKIKPAKIPSLPDPILKYNSQRYIGRGAFSPSEYNLAEIGRIADTDSYVSQAFSKKSALMFKEGWDLIGKNPRTIKYIKERFAQISRASGKSTNEIFRTLGYSLISKSNAFLVKYRKTEASGGRERVTPGGRKTLKPIAAYFIAPAETMEYTLSDNRISQWRQMMPDSQYKKYSPYDVIHMYYHKKDGFVFGTPIITPVVDDIRALRKIEENIELLIYQHLFPLFQYIVGTPDQPADVDETGQREIDIVRREIQYMPTEGGIVTPHRHQIKAIGAEGRAIRAEGYLEHFKKRVFSGLGISAVDFGEGNTTNKSTAENMSRNLIDAVKDFQQQMENFINEHMINELLLESTFGDNVLDEENIVKLKFKEIDVDAQIKRETHAADQFNKDIITWDEARMRMGLEPILMPTPEEVQNETDSADNYPEWHKTRWKLFKLPQLLIQSLNEPYSLAAKSIAKDNSLPMTSKELEETKTELKKIEEPKEAEQKNIKTVSPPTIETTDAFVNQVYLQTKKDIIDIISSTGSIDYIWINALIRTQLLTTVDKMITAQVLAFGRGFGQHILLNDNNFIKEVSSARNKFESRANKYITKLTENIINSLTRNTGSLSNINEIINKTRAVFDASEYRTKFIEDVELNKAENYGKAIALRLLKKEQLEIIALKTACDKCKFISKEPITLKNLIIDDIPPHHPGCQCKINIKK